MSKVQDVIARSMRLIRVLDPNETPEAEDYKTALMALNSMMTRMEANGTSVGWSNVSNPGDDLPAPYEAEEAIAYMLAMRIAEEYGVTPSAMVATMALQGEAALVRDNIVANPIINQSCGPEPYNYGGSYNIYSDSTR